MPTAAASSTSTGFLGSPALGGAASLHLPGERGQWTWCVSADALHCRHGAIVPRLAKAFHQPGMSLNDPTHASQGEGFVRALEKDGWQPIPHDPSLLKFEVKAFGEVSDQPPSCYLTRYEGLYQGRPAVYWTSAWERFRIDRRRTVREFDKDGEAAFLLDVRKQFIGELDESMVRAAVDPLVEEIRAQSRRDGNHAKLLLLERLGHIPPEHAPQDVLALLQEHNLIKKSRGKGAPS